MHHIGREIKAKIKQEIGDWLTVSVSIAPNLNKPDGLEEINVQNYHQIYAKLSLVDLPGIKKANAIRLNNVGIFNLDDFYQAKVACLRSAFRSIVGYYWYLRLRGWQIDDVDFAKIVCLCISHDTYWTK